MAEAESGTVARAPIVVRIGQLARLMQISSERCWFQRFTSPCSSASNAVQRHTL